MGLFGADKPELKRQGGTGVGWLLSPEGYKVVRIASAGTPSMPSGVRSLMLISPPPAGPWCATTGGCCASTLHSFGRT